MKTKIVFIITKSNWGGAQKYVFDLATNLPKDRFDPVVVLGEPGELNERLLQQSIRTITLHSLVRDVAIFSSTWSLLNPWAIVQSIAKELRVLREIIATINAERPDVVHLNSSKAGGLGALAARISGVGRVVFTAHGWPFREDRDKITKLLIWFLSFVTGLLAHTVIAVSNLDRAQSPVRSKTRTIHIAARAQPLRSRKLARMQLLEKAPTATLPTNSVLVGTVAELTHNKGLEFLIRAMTLVPSAQLFILGTGEDREELEQLISAHALGDRVWLLGHVPDAGTYALAFDIFVLPSVKEGFPYTLLEAGLAGLPTVATCVGGVPDIIEHEHTGLLVQPKDPRGLAAAIDRLVSQPKLRSSLGDALKCKVETDFTFDRMLEQTTAVYRDYTPTNSR